MAEADAPPVETSCASCAAGRRLTNRRGSVFWLCRRAATDPAYVRYPPQPVRHCPGWRQRPEDRP